MLSQEFLSLFDWYKVGLKKYCVNLHDHVVAEQTVAHRDKQNYDKLHLQTKVLFNQISL